MKVLIKLLIFLVVLPLAPVIAKKHTVSNSSQLYDAIHKAVNGDTVLIKKGTYPVKNIIIDKNIVIIGENFPVLDGQFKNEIFTITKAQVHVEGIHFQNVPRSNLIEFAGVKVLDSENVTVKGNRFKDCYYGIYFSASKKSSALDNEISGTPKDEVTTGNGVHAWKCDSLTIDRNFIKGHRDGIYFEFVTNSAVRHNYSTKNIRYGIHFMFSHNDLYDDNTFDENGAGVAVMYTKRVTMRNNHFINNWGGGAYGLLLKDISDSHIENNLFSSNTVGIYLDGCNRSIIKGNQFTRNGIALRLMANCDQNTVQDNNFESNTFNMGTSGNTALNTITENYWDNYDGYDLDRNGIGDIPFRPVSLFSVLIERVPQAMMIFRSFTASLLEKVEKIIPSLIPDSVLDEAPRMKPVKLEAITSPKMPKTVL